MPTAFSLALSFSDFSTERVPISTGRPIARSRGTSSTTASNFWSSVGKTRSGHASRITGRLVGTGTTHSLYTRRISTRFCTAVPLIPASFLYSLK